MNLKTIAVMLLCTASAYSQQAPAPSVEQIMEKSIAAAGGRQALQGMTSLVLTGATELTAYNATGATETYVQAPDKLATVTNIEGYGTVGRGYDGKIAWRSDPQQGTVELTGDRLANARLEAQFEGDLRWKQLYPKAEVTGASSVDGRNCWVIEMTPAEGDPVTRYYDAQTFLLAKVVATGDTAQGRGKIEIEFSDYRDIGNGVKLPHTLKISVPGVGDLITRYQDIKYNVAIDGAKFAKPNN